MKKIIVNMFFKNISIVKSPQSRNKVIFQCDEQFFNNWGIYNLLSCNDVGQDVHIHFINPSTKFLSTVEEIKLDIELSISKEILNTDINYFKLKSYYFVSRYFISNMLFDLGLIDTAAITDADIVFNEKIYIPNLVTLGVLHYPQHDNLWKQTGANYLFVTKERVNFLKNIITEYNRRLLITDFESINIDMDKIFRSNLYALDQVCMSHVLKNEKEFFNLTNIDNFITKNNTGKIWTLTGGRQKQRDDIQQKLKNRFNIT